MSNDGKNDPPAGMDPRDDEALWRLLGRAGNVEVSPYFSRRVLREVTLAGENRRAASGGWLSGLRRAWRLPRTAAAVWPGAVAVAGFWLAVVMTTPPSRQASPEIGTSPAATATLAQADEDVAPQDVEVIADLDNLLAREENRLWTEDTARF